jgi:hypothetical protein
MFFALFIENFALALISRTQSPDIATFIITILNPLYEFFINLGV